MAWLGQWVQNKMKSAWQRRNIDDMSVKYRLLDACIDPSIAATADEARMRPAMTRNHRQ